MIQPRYLQDSMNWRISAGEVLQDWEDAGLAAAAQAGG
jgi:hypothetical protein